MRYQDKTILIVGAGVFQTFAIKIAKGLGLRVCVIDMNQDSPGVALADDFIPVSTRDIDKAIEAAKVFNKRYRLDGVMTCGTDVAYTVAHIAKALRLPGIPPEIALWATDKGLMRTVLQKKGVSVPDFRIVKSFEEALRAVKKLKYPLVIKPVDNMGARGVRKLSSDKELERAWPEAFKNSRTQTVIIERFIPAKELSIETLVYKGKVYLITIADRIIKHPPYFIEKGHTLPTTLSKKEQDIVFDMAKKGIAALGIKHGPVKFDMRLSKKGAVIGEMTARLSGGFHSQMTEPLSSGMNSIKAVIDLSLGLPLDQKDIEPQFFHAAAERSLYPKPGKILSIKGLEKAESMKGIAGVFLNVKPGDTLYPLTSNIGKAGHVVGYGRTRKEAISNTLKAVKTIQIKTVSSS